MPICKPERNTSFPQGALWIGQGQWQFQGDLWTWKLSSLGCHPPGTVPLGRRPLRTSQQVVPWSPIHASKSGTSLRGALTPTASPEMSPSEGHCSKESHIEQQRRRAPQCIGGGGESSKMVNNPVPSEDGRQSLFYILPLSLRWAIAFLPRRLRRAMKAKRSFRDVQRIFKFTIKSSMTIFSSQGNLWSVWAALKQFPFQPVF